ncbi:type IV pilus inner membrane component PilO [Desulfoplanes sp.]
MNRSALTQKLEQLTVLQKILILAGLVILLGGGYWYFFLSPQLETVVKLHKDIGKINTQIDKYRAISLQLPKLRKEVGAKKTEFLFAQTLLPKDAQALERLLASFEMLAQEIGVGFMAFTPGKETVGDLYASRSVGLRIQGTFHDLMRFFDKLSRLDRLVQLQSLRLQPTGKQVGSSSALLSADSRLVVFRALTQKEMRAKEATKGKKGKK